MKEVCEKLRIIIIDYTENRMGCTKTKEMIGFRPSFVTLYNCTQQRLNNYLKTRQYIKSLQCFNQEMQYNILSFNIVRLFYQLVEERWRKSLKCCKVLMNDRHRVHSLRSKLSSWT